MLIRKNKMIKKKSIIDLKINMEKMYTYLYNSLTGKPQICSKDLMLLSVILLNITVINWISQEISTN